MIRVKKFAYGAMLALPLFYFGGCGQSARIPASLALGGGLGEFEVSAGETTQNSGAGDLGESTLKIRSGAISLDPDDITFIPADDSGSKPWTNYQATGGAFSVTAAVAGSDESETVCDTPVNEYGPFVVTLDENNEVASIEPASIEFEQDTVDLVNSGAFSLCITIESNVDGTVIIDELSFALGL